MSLPDAPTTPTDPDPEHLPDEWVNEIGESDEDVTLAKDQTPVADLDEADLETEGNS